MDQRERLNPYEESLLAALDGRQSTLWTALPGIVETFDADEQTATVQPSIQALLSRPDGSTEWVTLPLLLDCPVQFPAGGGCALTFPVAKGDECLVVFASRCVDAWWQQGGVQPQAEFRMHDLSDGFVLLGFRSVPRALTGVSAEAVELRSDDAETVIALDPTAQTVAITAPGGATMTADVEIVGSLHVTGAITSDVDVVAAGISLKTHLHSGVSTGGGNTGAPVP